MNRDDLDKITEHIMDGIAAMEKMRKSPIQMLDDEAADMMIEYITREDNDKMPDTTILMTYRNSGEQENSMCNASPISALHTMIHWLRALQAEAETSGDTKKIDAVRSIAIAMYAASKQYVVGATVEDSIKDSKIDKLVKDDISPKT